LQHLLTFQATVLSEIPGQHMYLELHQCLLFAFFLYYIALTPEAYVNYFWQNHSTSLS